MLRPIGVMRRRVELTDTWYRDSINPILAAKKDGTVVALLPSRTSGYSYFDKQRGRRIRVTKKVAEDFETDAYCFYRAFPLKSLNIKDLVVFMAKSLSFWDYAYVAALTLAVSLIGLITPYATQMIFSSVIPAGVSFYVLPMAILVVTSLVANNLFGICNTVLDTKIEKKLSVAVKSASMARLLLLPAGFFKSYSSGELSKRLESMDTLTKMLQDTIMNTGLTAVFSIVYVVQITRYSKALAVAAVAILLLNLVYTMVSSILQLVILGRDWPPAPSFPVWFCPLFRHSEDQALRIGEENVRALGEDLQDQCGSGVQPADNHPAGAGIYGDLHLRQSAGALLYRGGDRGFCG